MGLAGQTDVIKPEFLRHVRPTGNLKVNGAAQAIQDTHKFANGNQI